MWHFKTRVGTFWVVEGNDADHQYHLGIDDYELGIYSDVEMAAKDVCEQSTGEIRWDCQRRVQAPESIKDWNQGPPVGWN